MKIIAVGDIMPGGVLNKTSKEYISKDIIDIFNNADIRVGTLETAIGNEPNFFEEKMSRKADVIYAQDEDLRKLQELNINIVSLANNHFTDLGFDGAFHTIELLDQMGIKHCGAGKNLSEAGKPVVIEFKGQTYAFLAFCDWREETVGWCPYATENTAGVNPMYDEYVVEEIKKNKKLYDYVIIIPHWGIEYLVAPTRHVYGLAQKMIKAGADLILGGHTHCIQPVWYYKKTPVVFSMGNFLFPDRLITYPRSTYYSPEPIDLNKLPSTTEYPRYVETITYKIWKPMARYGMIACFDSSTKPYNCQIFYTHLNSNNYLELSQSNYFYSKKVNIVKLFLNSGLYVAFDFTIRTYYFIKRILKH